MPYTKAIVTQKDSEIVIVAFCEFGSKYVHRYVKTELGYYLPWDKLLYSEIKNIEFIE